MKMVTPELQPRWNAIITDVLRAFIEFCKQHDLTYYCCGGTAIGAIRHHGMIPWDDDIDVIMPRPDYDKFAQLATNINIGGYQVISPFNDERYPQYFMKLCSRQTTLLEDSEVPCVYGLYIDIFPIDGTPDNYEEARKQIRKFIKIKNKLQAIATHNRFGTYLHLLTMPKEWGRFVRKTIGYFFRSSYRKLLLKQMDDICYRYPYETSQLVAVYCGAYGTNEVFPKSWLQGTAPFQFEGLTVDLPAGYDEYLRHYFGDYMQLPPLEKRVSHHEKAYFNLEDCETLEDVLSKL